MTFQAGDVLHVTREASVQFTRPMMFRVIRVHDWPTYDGWIWLDGYQLNAAGDAVERRSIFVQRAGLRTVSSAADLRSRTVSTRPVAGQRPAASRAAHSRPAVASAH
jgi:hypothetical protein